MGLLLIIAAVIIICIINFKVKEVREYKAAEAAWEQRISENLADVRECSHDMIFSLLADYEHIDDSKIKEYCKRYDDGIWREFEKDYWRILRRYRRDADFTDWEFSKERNKLLADDERKMHALIEDEIITNLINAAQKTADDFTKGIDIQPKQTELDNLIIDYRARISKALKWYSDGIIECFGDDVHYHGERFIEKLERLFKDEIAQKEMRNFG